MFFGENTDFATIWRLEMVENLIVLGPHCAPQVQSLFSIVASERTPGWPGWTAEQLAQELSGQPGLGIGDDDHLLAFLLYRELPQTWEIQLLATHPGHRRRGLMLRLIQAWKARAPREITEFWLEVHEQNVAAIALYRRMGFLPVGKRPKYYHDDGSAILFKIV